MKLESEKKRSAAYQIGKMEALIKQLRCYRHIDGWPATVLLQQCDSIFEAMQAERAEYRSEREWGA